MALFGRKMSALRRPVDSAPIDYQMNVQLDQQPDVTPVMGQGVAAPMSKWQSFKENAPTYLDIIGATLQDVGGSLNGNYRNALGQRKAMLEREDLKRQQASVYGTLATDLETDPAGTLARAQAAGIPIDSLVDLVKSRQPRVVNTEYGAYTIYPDGRQEAIGSDPFADLRRKELEAKIGYYNAGAGLRQNQGQYWDARAAQPYAPKAPPRSGGAPKKSASGSGELPPGFVVDQ